MKRFYFIKINFEKIKRIEIKMMLEQIKAPNDSSVAGNRDSVRGQDQTAVLAVKRLLMILIGYFVCDFIWRISHFAWWKRNVWEHIMSN